MAALSVQVPYPVFYDRDGQPLDDGNIYIGVANLDPITNPLQVYYDEALTITASQPLVTSGGYVYRNGTPAQLYVNASDFSITVNDKKNLFIYNFPEGTGIGAGAASLEYDPPFTGALTSGYTVAEKLEQYVSVKDFGAVGDGVTNDSAAIQAAIDAFKPASGSDPVTGRVVFFPSGTYLINSSVVTYSGIQLVGEGASSILKAGPSCTGQIIDIADFDGSGQYRYGQIRNLAFKSTVAGVWAIKSSASLLLNSLIDGIKLDTTLGISVCEPNTYTQATTIQNIVSIGSVDQIINLSGNFNLIQTVDKEGGTGTSADPYILIGSSTLFGLATGNTLKKILLEGSGSANKTPIKFLNAQECTLEDYWMEASANNGFVIELDNSSVDISGVTNWSTFALGKVKLRNSSSIYIERMATNAEDLDWQPFFDADADSVCYVNSMTGRRANNVYKLATPENIKINRYVNETLLGTLPAGYSAQSFPDYVSGQNLLINPSFEAGMYNWSLSSADTPTFTTSDVGQGLMFECVSTTGFQLTQPIVVSAGQVGNPFTIRYVCKVVGAGFVIPIIAGSGELAVNRVSAGQGWQTITLTFRPTAAGTLNFGLWWVGVGGVSSTIYIDEMSVCCGAQGLVNPSKFGSFELSQKTFLCATAVPATGTWKRGDHVFNSAPAVGSPKGWICTVAGTPGTWVSEGNL